jgi:hypothetical protein
MIVTLQQTKDHLSKNYKTYHLRWLQKANTIDYVSKLDTTLKLKNESCPISARKKKFFDQADINNDVIWLTKHFSST